MPGGVEPLRSAGQSCRLPASKRATVQVARSKPGVGVTIILPKYYRFLTTSLENSVMLFRSSRHGGFHGYPVPAWSVSSVHHIILSAC
jgi:hypothetical protein